MGVLECLKCRTQFAFDAKAHAMKGKDSRGHECPHCESTMVIEVETKKEEEACSVDSSVSAGEAAFRRDLKKISTSSTPRKKNKEEEQEEKTVVDKGEEETMTATSGT